MPKRWLSTPKAAEELDRRTNYLLDNRLKLFKEGYHYRLLNPTAARPSYEWHIERCNEFFSQSTKRAAKIEKSQVAATKSRGVQLPLVEGVKPYEIE